MPAKAHQSWRSAIALIALALCPIAPAAPGQPNDAFSREDSVPNDPPLTSLSNVDSVSREFTVIAAEQNSGDPIAVDAISRELTAFSDLASPPSLSAVDAASREFTALNDIFAATLSHLDANSREITSYFIVRCDLNCDGVIDGRDVQIFGLALLNPSQYPIQFPTCLIATADTNNNGAIDPADIPGFVTSILTSGP